MDSREPQGARVAWRWSAAALAVVWVVAILPDLPLRYAPQVPLLLPEVTKVGARLVAMGAGVGHAIGMLAWLAWAAADGFITRERHDLAFVPLARRAWIDDFTSWGSLAGMCAAAVLPVGLLWIVGRYLSRAPERPVRHTVDLRRAARDTWSWVRTHPGGFAAIAAIDAALLGMEPATWTPDGHVLGKVGKALAISVGLGSLATVVQYGIGLSLVDGRPRSLRDVVGIGRVVRLAAMRVAGGVIAVAALLLLVIPGVVWMAATMLAGVVVVAEDVGPLRALERSAELTRGVRWKLCAAFAVIGVPTSLVANVGGENVAHAVGLVVGTASLLFAMACYAQLAGSAPATRAGFRWRSLLGDPAFVVGGAWSLALASVVVLRVGGALLHPEPSLLLLPPLESAQARTDAPVAEWCAYSLHSRRRECEVAIEEAHRFQAFGVDGYAFDGARCVPLPDDAWSSWQARVVGRAAEGLAAALPSGTTIRRPYRIGTDEVAVAVVEDEPDGAVVLALDAGDPATDTDGVARAARLAAAGVPDYWRVELHQNRDPVLGGEMLAMWSEPQGGARGYATTTRSSRNQDLRLRLSALPAARVAIDDILPERACSLRATAPAVQEARGGEAGAFVVDGSEAPPALVFDDFDGDGVAHRLRFTAVAPDDGFDPAASGLAVSIAGPFQGEGVLDVVLPAGARWTSALGERSWTYHDADGSAGGVTDVLVREAGDGALSWEVRGGNGRWSTSLPVVRDWGRLDVRLGPPGAAGRAAYFRTGGPQATCRAEPAGAVTCQAPTPPEPCDVAEPNDLVRCTVERLAMAEDVFFASHGRYFSGACGDLGFVRLPAGLSCALSASATTFSVSAWHPRMTLVTGCQWNSGAASTPLRCS